MSFLKILQNVSLLIVGFVRKQLTIVKLLCVIVELLQAITKI